MAESSAPEHAGDSLEPKLKIYFLPNLLTAGNLFCGFVALTKIVEANLPEDFSQIKYALGFILLACIFDLLDGRIARMGGSKVRSAGSSIRWRIWFPSAWPRPSSCTGSCSGTFLKT